MQNEIDDDDLVECADCGAPIAPGADPSYALEEGEAVLCFECAIRRGGEYDAPEDRWTVPPDVQGLAGEATVEP